MAGLQETVDSWFTSNPNATNTQIASAVQGVGGLDANAGLAGILASRLGIDPSEIQNYYNNFAATANAAGMTGATAGIASNLMNGATGATTGLTNNMVTGATTGVMDNTMYGATASTAGIATDTLAGATGATAGIANNTMTGGATGATVGIADNTLIGATGATTGATGATGATTGATGATGATTGATGATGATTGATGATGATGSTTNGRPRKPYRPTSKEFMEKTGADFRTAADMLYGVVGSNKDTRDWTKIMASDDPLAAARRATYNMYGGVTVKNINYGGQIIPKLVAADGTLLTVPGKRNANFGLEGLWYDNLTKKSTANDIADAYDAFLRSPKSVGGIDSQQNQDAAAKILKKRGISDELIKQGYQKYLNPDPLYTKLNKDSTPEQIATAYDQYAKDAGGDTEFTQKAAADFLETLGISGQRTQDAYSEYLGKSSPTSDLFKQFGVTGKVTMPTKEGILSGFKYAKDSGLDEESLKETLGESTFNKYKSLFADYAKSGITSAFADNKLSFEEANDLVKFGRDYGYDSQQMADLTGQKKEFFDAVNTSYDEAVNNIVDTVLGGDDAKTTGDKIIKILALEEKYGFTYEDIAKATGLSLDEVRGYIDPVKNFGTSYKEMLTKPDVTGKDILALLEKSKNDQGINKIYGTNIDAQIARLNELNSKWGKYNLDGYQAENISNQLGKITDAAGGKNWSGEWMGGGENAKLQATALLMRKGVDNLSDLGVKRRTQQLDSNADFYEGQHVKKDDEGRKYIYEQTASGDAETSTKKYLPKDAKTTPGIVESDDQDAPVYRPLSEKELATYNPETGKFDAETFISDLIDKSTGKVIASNGKLGGPGAFFNGTNGNQNNFVLDSYDTGNFLKGENKDFGIMMTDEGIPVPYQTTEKDGFIYSPAFPIMMAMIAPGVSSALSGALPGAATAATATSAAIPATLMNQVMTQAIMGGGIAGLTGQDILKGAFFGGIGAPISSAIGSMLPSGLSESAVNAIKGAGTSITKGVLQGGNFEDLLGQGVLSGLTNYGLGEFTKGLDGTFNLTPKQINLLTGIALPLIQGKDINPMTLINSLATTGQQQTQKATP